MKLPENYMERVYSGWLGKVIGIRLGAAVEGWSYERIQNVFGSCGSIPPSKNFAADDDSNGPMFFIRSLEDCRDLRSFSAQDVADALLNYAPMSTDFLVGRLWCLHRAYGLSEPAQRHSRAPQRQCGAERLHHGGADRRANLHRPLGPGIPGNPEQAARLGKKSRQRHPRRQRRVGRRLCGLRHQPGLCGAQPGGCPGKGLALHPPDCEYARVVRAVTAFYREHPDNWRECFRYVHDNFGYDKYPGNCHIIPNAAVMILSMLYGGGDFAKTLCICNMCGWDTDCNGQCGLHHGCALRPGRHRL